MLWAFIIGIYSIIFDVEIFREAISLRSTLIMRQNLENNFVLLDKQAVVMDLSPGKSSSSVRLTTLFHTLAKNMNEEFI